MERQRKKILVTGAGGLLGSEFAELAAEGLHQIFPRTRAELDITKPGQVSDAFAAFRPDVVINCAAYTKVDQAELEREAAWEINVRGAGLLTEVCKKHGAKLVHYSTDAIFDGEKTTPYVESDSPAPIGFYGSTKWESEKAVRAILSEVGHLILRITWPYGRNGVNFINNTIRNLKELTASRTELRAVTDQVGTPNPARLLARKTLTLIEKDVSGTFHLSCSGACSKFELISFLLKHVGASCTVIPAMTRDFPAPAKRPKSSVLGTERIEVNRRLELPSWQEALVEYLESEACYSARR